MTHSRRRLILSCLTLSGVLAPCWAQIEAVPTRSPREGAAAQTLRAFERDLDGQLTGWSARGPLWNGKPAPDDWIEIVFAPGPQASAPWVLELGAEAWLPGLPGPGNGEEAVWLTPSGLEVPIDLLWLRRLARGRQLRAREASEKDLLWLRTEGETLDKRTGWLLGWRQEGLDFEVVEGERSFPWNRIAALQLLEEPLELASSGVWLGLAQGGRLPCQPRRLSGDRLIVDLPWREAWEVPLARIASLRRRDPSWIDLGQREPDFVSGPVSEVLNWDPKRGRSVEGRPLRVAGRERASGFGTRVPSEIAFDRVGPGQFFCEVGVDDEVAGFRNPQRVRFRVLLDDEELARSRELGFGEAPQSLRLALPRAGRLRLIAEPAQKLPFGGHADWLDPMLQTKP